MEVAIVNRMSVCTILYYPISLLRATQKKGRMNIVIHGKIRIAFRSSAGVLGTC